MNKDNENIEKNVFNQRYIAYIKIRDAIIYDHLKPGERLIERQICSEFNLGRTPFREALWQLEAEGYITVIPNKGAVINKISHNDVENIYLVVAELEGYAAELAAENISESDRKELLLINSELKKAKDLKDYSSWYKKNLDFHDRILIASGNPYLRDVTNSLRRRVSRFRMASILVPTVFSRYYKSHEDILNAIFEGKNKKAGKLMRNHILNSRELLVDFLKQFPGF